MKISFKSIPLVALFVFVLSFSTSALANDDVVNVKPNEEIYVKNSPEDSGTSVENFNVTEVKPNGANDSGISILGYEEPVASHDVSISGQLNFSGNAQWSNLFTNKYFTGENQYNIKIVNNHSTSALKVYLLKSDQFWYIKSYDIAPGYTLYTNPTGLAESGKYYLQFIAPSNFTGYVR